jgi:hypothetical protein
MKQGSLLLGARLMGTTVNVVHEARCPDIGPICAQRDEPPQVHDQRFWIAELRLVGEYAATGWLSVELQLPVRLSATSIIYRRLDGTPFTPETPDIHHRNETLVGIGDPWLSARGRLTVGGFLLSAQLGLTLPLGRTETNPFALGRAGLAHQHTQFGTGTFDPLVGLEASRPFDPFVGRAYGLAQLSLYENSKGFQAGSRFTGGVGLDWRVAPPLQLGATGEVMTELPERWDGRVEQDGNLGRTDVLVGLLAKWTLGATSALLSVRVPVYQHFIVEHHEGGQLRYPAIVLLSVQHVLDPH